MSASIRTVQPGTVHILSSVGSPGAALYRALRPKLEARHWAAAPSLHEVRPGDLVVVDLADPHPPMERRQLEALLGLGRATLCLIPGKAPIQPHWLELAARPGVHVLGVASGDGQTSDLRVAELLRLVQGPSGRRVADLVLSAEPLLRFVQPLVEAVCLDPWGIRRPRDLAVRTGFSLGAAKRQCLEMGFKRTEHFILCVRLLAYSQLVATEHLSIRSARCLAGLGDPSNMRRHAHRAALRSPMFGRALHQSICGQEVDHRVGGH